MSDQPVQSKTASAAVWLGAAGVVPFAAASAATWIVPQEEIRRIAFLFVAYGAVILSFLGAVHWGLVISPGVAMDEKSAARWLGLGVIPALIGWIALMLDTLTAIALLLPAFAGALALDAKAVAAGLAPAWYGRLRLRLSAAVILLLLLGAAGIWRQWS